MLRGEKGEALLAVLLLAALIFIVGGAAVAMGTTVRKTAVYEIRQKKAYYIAEAGVERVLAYIDENQEWFENEVAPGEQVTVVSGQDYGGGRIESAGFSKLEDVGTGTKIRIVSAGAFERVTRKVTAEALVTTPADLLRGLAVLPASPTDFDFKGSFNFVGSDDDDEDRATIMWNGSVDFGEGNSLSNVDIYASGDITIRTQPGHGGCNDSVTYSVYSHWDVPAYPLLDVEWYRTIAQEIYNQYYRAESESVEFPNDFDGTPYQGVIFVEGDLTISRSYTGTAIIVATGDITVDGSLTAGSEDGCDQCEGGQHGPGGGGDCNGGSQEDNSVLVLMAPNGTVSLEGQGNATVEAFIIAGAVTDLRGNQTIKGAVLTRDLEFRGQGSGNVTIEADLGKLERLVAETNFLQGIRLDVKLTSWREGS